MKVFVTGAAGFIGSRLCAALLDRGDTVVGFDNLHPYYDRSHKDRHLADLLDRAGFTFVEGDLRDSDGLAELFTGHDFDAVAHIAAMAAVRYSVQHPLLYGDVNVQGSINLMDAARQHGQVPCVLASTGSVYGSDTPVPFVEDAAAAHPLAPYPASKRSMELFAHSFAHVYQLPVTVLRFFNVYGPHGRPDMMPWQWSQKIHRGEPLTLFNGGRMHRDWTYIDDIVRGFVAALDAGYPCETINLGGGAPTENLEFVHILERLLERQARIETAPAPASEPLYTFASIEKAGRLLGWKPEVKVETGLARFVEWLRSEDLLK